MANRKITNCSECAYVKKHNDTLWCPFHDVPVSSKLVCDDFLDEFQSPQWISLANGMNGKSEVVPQHTGKDIFIYIVSALSWVLYVVIMVLWCKKL